MSPLAGLHLDREVAEIDLRRREPMLDLVGLVTRRTAPARPLDRADVAASAITAPPSSTRTSLHATAALVPADALEMARWLTPAELAVAQRRGDRGRAAHVMGRVAAKQALQAHLVAVGLALIEADRIEITNDERGRPTVAVRGARVATRHARITIAHCASVAVAAATLHPAAVAGEPGIGIDVEPIEPRSSRFERLTMSAGEQALPLRAGDTRDAWLTRLWAAKEAASKATGRGLQGRPKAFEVSAVDGDRLLVAGRWVATEVVAFAGTDHIVAITDDLRSERAWHRS